MRIQYVIIYDAVIELVRLTITTTARSNGVPYLLDQKKGGKTQENEKTAAIGNSRDQHAGARGSRPNL